MLSDMSVTDLGVLLPCTGVCFVNLSWKFLCYFIQTPFALFQDEVQEEEQTETKMKLSISFSSITEITVSKMCVGI